LPKTKTKTKTKKQSSVKKNIKKIKNKKPRLVPMIMRECQQQSDVKQKA
jgi:hypothetical protein